MTLLKDEIGPESPERPSTDAASHDKTSDQQSSDSTEDSATPDSSTVDDNAGTRLSSTHSTLAKGPSILPNDKKDQKPDERIPKAPSKMAPNIRIIPEKAGTPKGKSLQRSDSKVNASKKVAATGGSSDIDSDAEQSHKKTPQVKKKSNKSLRRSRTAWNAMQFPDDLESIFKNDSDSDQAPHPLRTPRRDRTASWADFVISDMQPEDVVDNSESRREWLRQKRDEQEQNPYLDQLMSMVGLEEVKAHFLAVKARVKAAQTTYVKEKLKLHLVLIGKDGTGKRSIAQLYARFLVSIGAVTKGSYRKMALPPTWQPRNVKKPGEQSPAASRHPRIIFYDTSLVGRVEMSSDDDQNEDGSSSDSDSDSSSSSGSTSIISSPPRAEIPAPMRPGMAIPPSLPGLVVPLRFIPGPFHPAFTQFTRNEMKFLSKAPRKSVIILTCRPDSRGENIVNSQDTLQHFHTPITLPDYTADELSQICARMMVRRGCPPQDGLEDWSLQALVRRVAKNRDSGSFANVHDLEKELDAAFGRRALRKQKDYTQWFKNVLHEQSQSSHTPVRADTADANDGKERVLTSEDLLGPEPEDMRQNNASWKKLQDMIGLNKIKKECGDMIDLAQLNYQRELLGMEPLKISLNRLLVGPSGVGKTVVAQLYAQLLIDLKLVSGSKVMLRNPTDLIGNCYGQSESKTKAVLDQSKGHVLIIDDAHMLYPGNTGAITKTDPFRVAVLDTIVASVSADPEDRGILLVGYDHEMEQLFLNNNPGLRRRFPKETALRFETYTEDELCQIMDLKATRSGLDITADARTVARRALSRMRMSPKFGNAGDVENLINQAKIRLSARVISPSSKDIHPATFTLEREDIDPDWNRDAKAEERRVALFESFVGFDKIVEKFQQYQLLSDGLRSHGIDPKPHVPWAFVFKGPPGTGKTSTARKIGQLYYDMGLLATSEVVICTVTNLIAEHVGGTGPKVRNILETGLGKVLFIDEAYRLALENHGRGHNFHREAVGELVDAMTQPRYQNNLVIVMAGYSAEMDFLLESNPGLRGRFPEQIDFLPMSSRSCYQHLKQEVGKVDISIIDENDPDEVMLQRVYQLFDDLSRTKGWASGRDVETLAKTIVGKVYMEQGRFPQGNGSKPLHITLNELIDLLQELRSQRGNFRRVIDDLYD